MGIQQPWSGNLALTASRLPLMNATIPTGDDASKYAERPAIATNFCVTNRNRETDQRGHAERVRPAGSPYQTSPDRSRREHGAGHRRDRQETTVERGPRCPSCSYRLTRRPARLLSGPPGPPDFAYSWHRTGEGSRHGDRTGAPVYGYQCQGLRASRRSGRHLSPALGAAPGQGHQTVDRPRARTTAAPDRDGERRARRPRADSRPVDRLRPLRIGPRSPHHSGPLRDERPGGQRHDHRSEDPHRHRQVLPHRLLRHQRDRHCSGP